MCQSITKQQWLFGWISFSLTIPNTYLLLGFPLLMRQYGWSGTEIGLFQLIALPAVFKFVLAIPIQYYRFGEKHYRNWLVLLLVLLMIFIILLSIQNWLEQPTILFLFAFMTIFLITWIDIPLNALLVKLLPREQQLHAGGIRAISLFLGAIFGSGIMLVVQLYWGWFPSFAIIAINLILSLMAIFLLPDSNTKVVTTYQTKIVVSQVINDWQTFFLQANAIPWVILLLTCFPIIAAIWLYQKPFLIDYGMEPSHVAWIVGVGGGIIGSLFSMISRKIINYLPIGKVLPLCIGWAVMALITLLITVGFGLSIIWLMLSLFLVASSMGIASTLFLGLMFNFTRQNKRATDYGLQASLFVLARTLVPILAGVLLDLGGYILMLTSLSFIMLILFVLSLYQSRFLT